MNEQKQMPGWKKIVLGVIALLTALVGGYGVSENLGASRTNQPERAVTVTSTRSDYSGVAFSNVNDFDAIGFTAVFDSTSGTLRQACSMQDVQPTLAATSSANRWDYVDFIDTNTEASVDGSGLAIISESSVRQFVIRNSVWKWCVPVWVGANSVAGLGTTTLFQKPVDNL